MPHTKLKEMRTHWLAKLLELEDKHLIIECDTGMVLTMLNGQIVETISNDDTFVLLLPTEESQEYQSWLKDVYEGCEGRYLRFSSNPDEMTKSTITLEAWERMEK